MSINIEDAVKASKALGYDSARWKEIQAGVGLSGADVDGLVGRKTVQAVYEWQVRYNAERFSSILGEDGVAGSVTCDALKGS